MFLTMEAIVKFSRCKYVIYTSKVLKFICVIVFSIEIDLEKDLESQGPFDAIFHKLSDFLVLCDQGDVEAGQLIAKFEVCFF